MGDDLRPIKRSRFDQTDTRRREQNSRSRSPSSRQTDNLRTRSPLSRTQSPAMESNSKPDPAAAADCVSSQLAAAAALINASLRKGTQHADTNNRSNESADDKSQVPGKIYVADGDFIKDIEINDLRNRYTLTKGSTQQMIKDETGSDVTTRGSYYPDKNMATAASPPLYLHVTSTSKDGLEKAVKIIDDLMQKELPNLVDERRFRRREPTEQADRDEFGRRKWPEERIPIDLEPIAGFNLRAQVVGQGGAFVKHIQTQTRCRVQIKGHGSGFIESSTGRESDEAMFLHVAGPDPADVEAAKALCLDLLDNVKEQYQAFKDNPPQRGYGGYRAGGDRQDSGGDRHYGGYGYNNRNQRHTNGSADANGDSAANTDYSATNGQYYGATGAAGAADPYAAWGGYHNYVAYYQYYYAQGQGQSAIVQDQENGAVPPQGSEVPPAPPASGLSPPPPPPQ
ncbi:hypothetical protein N7495_000455 [Penicillium taxi]|uniref:uncharacterized protein n=1 Tax=Penicillium taxi TaxID=168475 RepID=UPI0025454F9F|nr:uncharacterized protein N7495_000455 [Penicillium taxi]KAJ5907773.1 hypothetical protein N7495_000455 [Penicillium taxi]